MKTKSFSKLIALALCVAMAFSMSVTAFAAGSADVATSVWDTETVTADANKVADVAVSSMVIPVPASTGKGYSIGERTAGQIVRVEMEWKSVETPLFIGMALDGATEGVFYKGTGGSVDIYTAVSKDGTYNILILNPSDTDVTITKLEISVYNPA